MKIKKKNAFSIYLLDAAKVHTLMPLLYTYTPYFRFFNEYWRRHNSFCWSLKISPLISLSRVKRTTHTRTHTTLGRYAISQRTTLSKTTTTKTPVKFCWQQQRWKKESRKVKINVDRGNVKIVAVGVLFGVFVFLVNWKMQKRRCVVLSVKRTINLLSVKCQAQRIQAHMCWHIESVQALQWTQLGFFRNQINT